jgi:TonB family protein
MNRTNALAAVSAALLLALTPASPALARISTELIRRVVHAHLPEIRRCYDDRLPARPGLAGRVSVVFTVEPDGHVSDASLTSTTLHDPPMEACLLDRVREFQFPPLVSGASIRVNYPFVFEAPAPPSSSN